MSNPDLSIAEIKLLSFRDRLIKVHEINAGMERFINSLIKTLISAAIILFILILFNILYIVYLPLSTVTSIPLSISSVILVLMVIILSIYLYLRTGEVKVKGLYEDWESSIKEGISGILKILESIDWDATEYEINKAKSSYTLLIIIRILILTFLMFMVIGGSLNILALFIGIPINEPMYIIGLVVISLTTALAIEWNSISRYRDALWSIDSLLWELRWLYHEFRKLQT